MKSFFTLFLAAASAASDAFVQIPFQQAPLSEPVVAKRPNVVFILTDDQDIHLGSLSYQPLLKKHLLQEGTFYRRHFCTVAVCCPSRVNLWTGRAAHNTNVTDIVPPYGNCFLIAPLSSNLSRWLSEVCLSRS